MNRPTDFFSTAAEVGTTPRHNRAAPCPEDPPQAIALKKIKTREPKTRWLKNKSQDNPRTGRGTASDASWRTVETAGNGRGKKSVVGRTVQTLLEILHGGNRDEVCRTLDIKPEYRSVWGGQRGQRRSGAGWATAGTSGRGRVLGVGRSLQGDRLAIHARCRHVMTNEPVTATGLGRGHSARPECKRHRHRGKQRQAVAKRRDGEGGRHDGHERHEEKYVSEVQRVQSGQVSGCTKGAG